jgi:hypothetical protein
VTSLIAERRSIGRSINLFDRRDLFPLMVLVSVTRPHAVRCSIVSVALYMQLIHVYSLLRFTLCENRPRSMMGSSWDAEPNRAETRCVAVLVKVEVIIPMRTAES